MEPQDPTVFFDLLGRSDIRDVFQMLSTARPHPAPDAPDDSDTDTPSI